MTATSVRRALFGLVLCIATQGACAQTDAECLQFARATGVPEKLVEALYLNEWNSPLPFAAIPCGAKAGAGAKFRFSRGGLFTDESFSVAAKQSVRVWVRRQVMGDGRTMLLVPVKYEVNGSRFEVTRANIQLLSFLLRQAIANE